MKPRFLSMDEVLQIHAHQLEVYGGSPGIRDLGSLESALAMPGAGFGEEYLHKDLFEMAAAYLFHLCQNHALVDGNKRVALASCRYFLHLNNLELRVDTDEWLTLTMSVARGAQEKSAVADFLRSRVAR